MVNEEWRAARRVAVFGSWRPEGLSRDALLWSYELGRLIADRKMILVTGGSGGIVLSCRKGCRRAGGINLGVLPDAHVSDEMREEAVVDIAVPTGLGVLGRMPILTEMADYAIAIGGGAGTLVEVALTYLQRKVVVVVEGLRRPGDPAVSQLLTRQSTITLAHSPVVCGYLDSKPDHLVRPVHVVGSVTPEIALSIANDLYEQIGKQPMATSEVSDR